MSAAVLFERIVIEVEARPDGTLRPRPGVLPQKEPARSEGRVHRQLAALAQASPEEIARFASTHGLLRLGSAWLQASESPEARRALVAMGQQAGDDFTRARRWLEEGRGTKPPTDVLEVLAFAAVMTELPEAVQQGMDLARSGAPAALVEKTIGTALPDPAAFFALFPKRVAPYLTGQRPLPRDTRALLRGLDALEWLARLLGGVEAAPAWVNRLGGPRKAVLDLLRNQPEALLSPEMINDRNRASVSHIEELAHETIETWRAVAAWFAAQGEAVRLVRRAIGVSSPVSADEKARLIELHRTLADNEAPRTAMGAELGERIRALLRAELEAWLARDCVWPVRRGSVAGLYSRALVALWQDLTDERPRVACATEGCPGDFVLAHGRLYCDACQLARQQEAVRVSRAKTLATGA